MLFALI